MKAQNYETYLKLFTKLFKNDDISVVWKSRGGSVRTDIDLEDELSKIDDSLSEDDFFQLSFEIISLARLIAMGNVTQEEEEGTEVENNDDEISFSHKIDLISEYFITQELIDHINVQTQPLTNVIDEFDYEIITKRNKKDPSKIMSYSVMLNLLLRDNFSNLDNGQVERVAVEMTEKEIRDTIEMLQESLTALEKMKN
ncbi:hypothetical protein ABE178_25360 [Priestia megaterium]